jgi:hypothetical protein
MSSGTVTAEQFAAGCRGRSLEDFVWHHQEQQDADARARGQDAISQSLPPAVLAHTQAFLGLCTARPELLKQDCGDVAADFFRGVRESDSTASDVVALDAFTYLALKLADVHPIRGRRYVPVYVALLVSSLILVNVTDATIALIAGWLLGGFAVFSLFGALGKPR